MPRQIAPKTLVRWNRLARRQAELTLISSMYKAAAGASAPIDTFATWLLVGTGAVGSFYVTNSDKLLPVLKQTGFQRAGLLLAVSCIFGLLAKIWGLKIQIIIDINKSTERMMLESLLKHEQIETDIQTHAKLHGVRINSSVRFGKIITEFLLPFPWYIRRLSTRAFREGKRNPHSSHHTIIKSITTQSHFALLQSLLFIAFIIVGIYAAAT